MPRKCRMQRAAGIVPVFVPVGAEEPHFLMMQRRSEKLMGGEDEVLALAGFRKKGEVHLKKTALRETGEEGKLPVDDRGNEIGCVKGHFAPGVRGTLRVRHYKDLSPITALEMVIAAGVHPEFKAVRRVSLSQLKNELKETVPEHLRPMGEKIVKLVDDWWLLKKPIK